MSVYLEALILANTLLEAEIRLKPPAEWDTFTRALPGHRFGHGLNEFLKNVAKEDQDEFCSAMRRLRTAVIRVPDASKWCLKMPLNYGIYGKMDQGVSVLGKKEMRMPDSRPVDNPTMLPLENQRWRIGL